MALRITRITDSRGGISFLRSWKPWTVEEFIDRRKKALASLGIPFKLKGNIFTYSDDGQEFFVEIREDDSDSLFARR